MGLLDSVLGSLWGDTGDSSSTAVCKPESYIITPTNTYNSLGPWNLVASHNKSLNHHHTSGISGSHNNNSSSHTSTNLPTSLHKLFSSFKGFNPLAYVDQDWYGYESGFGTHSWPPPSKGTYHGSPGTALKVVYPGKTDLVWSTNFSDAWFPYLVCSAPKDFKWTLLDKGSNDIHPSFTFSHKLNKVRIRIYQSTKFSWYEERQTNPLTNPIKFAKRGICNHPPYKGLEVCKESGGRKTMNAYLERNTQFTNGGWPALDGWGPSHKTKMWDATFNKLENDGTYLSPVAKTASMDFTQVMKGRKFHKLCDAVTHHKWRDQQVGKWAEQDNHSMSLQTYFDIFIDGTTRSNEKLHDMMRIAIDRTPNQQSIFDFLDDAEVTNTLGKKFAKQLKKYQNIQDDGGSADSDVPEGAIKH